MKCPRCNAELMVDKFKDIIRLEDYYFTVYIVACTECGYVDDDNSYIE